MNFRTTALLVTILTFLFLNGCSTQKTLPPNLSYQDALYQSKLSPYLNVWDRIFARYSIPKVSNKRIDAALNWYLRHPKHLAAIQKRAEPYLYLIIEEIEAKNLPGEYALLPAVESAFKPYAYSRTAAAGLWQFMPATGKEMGLEQNWWYDGRRNIHDSTEAATAYLKRIAGIFDNDWLLALASYNAGAGRVGKAIKKNQRLGRPTDYWSLPLPKETRDYVPKLLAIAKIFANAQKYNIRLNFIPNKPAVESIALKTPLDLAKAAKLANMPLKEFFNLNPAFNQWSAAPNQHHHLVVPSNKAVTFKRNLAFLSDYEKLPWVSYQVKQGDTLKSLAKKYKCSQQMIKQVNHLKSAKLHQGQQLKIPQYSLAAHAHPFDSINKRLAKRKRHKKAKKRAKKQRKSRKIIYTVRRGDTLWGVSKKFKVSRKNIAQWNKFSTKKSLRRGQKLIIKTGKKSTRVASFKKKPRSIHYTVKKGDSLSRISKKFKVSIANLRKWNNLGKFIRPGQKLKVYLT